MDGHPTEGIFVKQIHRVALATFTAGIVVAGSAIAADDMIPFGKETFQLNLGYYRPNFKTSFSQSFPGSPIPPGTISAENDLNFDDTLDTWRLGGYWRFADRHRLVLSGALDRMRSPTA